MNNGLNLREYIKSSPWDKLDKYNCNLFPSVAKDNFNHKNKSRFYLLGDMVVAQLVSNNGEKTWTFSGSKKINSKKIIQAIELAKKVDPNFMEFILVSRDILPSKLPGEIYISSRSREEHDYIYSTKATKDMSTSKYSGMRRYTKKFINLYGQDLETLIYEDNSDKLLNKELEELYLSWLDHANLSNEDKQHETEAFQKYLYSRVPGSYKKPYKIILKYRGKIVGISINDIISKNTAINLYFFCNLNLTGISHYLFSKTTEKLHELGIKFLDFQEDRGSKGLRKFKKQLRPTEIYKLVSIRVR